MPTTLVRSLKASKPHLVFCLESFKGAAVHCVISLRPVAVPQVEEQCRVAGENGLGLGFLGCSLPPPVYAKKAQGGCSRFYWCYPSNYYYFRLDTKGLTVVRMEAEKGEKAVEKSQEGEKGKEDEEEEAERLQKEHEEERKRVQREQDLEEKIGPPPEKPLAGDCCGQGCQVCVWDTYWEELDEYKKLKKAAEESG